MAREAKPKSVIVYAYEDGKEPFTDWLYALRDTMGRKRILARVARLAQGNYGDCEPVGESVSELRMFFPAIGSISARMRTTSSFCCAAATRGAKSKTFGRPKLAGRSI
jgi:hypothetical protein